MIFGEDLGDAQFLLPSTVLVVLELEYKFLCIYED